MAHSRLSTALAEGLIDLPDGPVAVYRPPVGYDLVGLARDRVRIVTTWRPDYDGWAAGGYAVSADPVVAPVAVVVVPRAKALARSLIAQAAATAQLVVVDGQTTDGVNSLFRDCRARLGDLPSLPKAHGRLFWFVPDGQFADWAAPQPQRGEHGFTTTAGVFSDGSIDAGSELLADALPAKMPKRIADLGAGWGYLAAAVLARDGVQRVDLFEAEKLALDCARLNIPDSRAEFHWTDATGLRRAEFDGVVMNPPFHVGRAADPGLGRAMIDAAARVLTPSGQMWMVANRHLPYEAHLAARFRNVTDLPGSGGFKLFHASRPLGAAR